MFFFGHIQTINYKLSTINYINYLKINNFVMKINNFLLATLLLFASTLSLSAQVTQVLRGTILDKQSESPLVGAAVQIKDVTPMLGAVANENGNFEIKNVPTGRYTLQITFIGYKWGKFSVFGIGGMSEIDFVGKDLDTTDVYADRKQDAYARSKFGVLGVRHNVVLNPNTYARTVVSGSYSENMYDEYRDKGNEIKRYQFSTADKQMSYRVSSFINKKFNAKWNTRTGLLYQNLGLNTNTRDRIFTPDFGVLKVSMSDVASNVDVLTNNVGILKVSMSDVGSNVGILTNNVGILKVSMSDVGSNVGILKNIVGILKVSTRGVGSNVGILKNNVGILKVSTRGVASNVGILTNIVGRLKFKSILNICVAQPNFQPTPLTL